MATILIRDEVTTGNAFREFFLKVPAELITARELIERRVQAEVTEYNTALPEYFRGLVQPKETESGHNGYRLKRRRQIDWREQAAVAVEMFQTNGFVLIVDDQQVDALDTEIAVKPDMRASFLKLIPLVGG
jgi:hypothetical protein